MSAAREVDAYVAVGSNVDPAANVSEALRRLRAEVSVEAVSTFYRTEPEGPPGQPAYLNGVVRVRTGRSARELKYGVLRRIEETLGRRRSADRFAPRVIDLDLVLYGDQVLDEPGLRLPDPAVHERPFVAVPLLEVAPDLVLPDTGEKLSDLVAARDRTGLVAELVFSQRLRRGEEK